MSSTASTRLWREPSAQGEQTRANYSSRLIALLEAPLPLRPGTSNELDPPALEMSPEARALWSLDREDLATLLAVARSSQLAPLVMLAMDSTARQGELLALRWTDVDLVNGTLRIGRSLRRLKQGFVFSEPKTKRSKRTVEISPPALPS